LNAIRNTLFVGKVLNYFEATDSTNTLAADWLLLTEKNGAGIASSVRKHAYTEGVVFYTYHQTAGRGQYGNKWESEPFMNIAISIILSPTFIQAREQFHLNKAVSLAVRDTISSYFESPFAHVLIKWANDIYVEDKKICGILVQNTLSGTQIQHAIVGIGLNINQQHFDNLPHATSLKIETGKDYALFEVIEKLCQNIEQRYLQLKTRQFNTIHQDYISKLYRWNEEALYQYPDGKYFQGKIVDVNDSGRLLVESKKGIEEFDIKEIKFVI
jgi:BirA family biotin operon repressor/biotin-[acetyl-CoA-carboxylase] ligase